MSKKKTKKGKHLRGSSTLKQHKRLKKTLIPPLVEIGVKVSNWTADTVPELLWHDSLIAQYDFDRVGGIFHKAVDIIDTFVPSNSKEVVTGLVSSFSLVPVGKRADVRLALSEAGLFDAAFPESFIHSVALYEDNPMAWLFEDWRRAEHVDYEIGINHLKQATKRLLASHSQHATRCRMLPLARMAKHGKIVFIKGATDHLADELSDYSDSIPEEDQKKTEASVRAMFGGYLQMSDMHESSWPAHFWRHNYKISVCEPSKDIGSTVPDSTLSIQTVEEAIQGALKVLQQAYEGAHLRAELDLYAPDRDEVLFGLTSRQFRMFSLVAREPRLWALDLGSVLHRIMADTLIVLSYLITKNETALFERFKRYSLGKQKLYKLQLSDYGERAGLDLSEVEDDLAATINAEIFEQLLPIELGSVFESTDMRRMAYDVGLEDLYRLVYSPTSADLHGEWVSLRQHNLTLCLNPMHRYHRLPKLETSGVISTGTVLQAASLLASTVRAWLRAYGLEAQYASAADAFETEVAKALAGSVASAAAAS